jgi:hypothetical protein
MLEERLANRKSSLPSADSDLMAANDSWSEGEKGVVTMFNNSDEIIKGLQKPTWEIGDQDKVAELEARVRELEAKNQRLMEAIRDAIPCLEDWITATGFSEALRKLYATLNEKVERGYCQFPKK